MPNFTIDDVISFSSGAPSSGTVLSGPDGTLLDGGNLFTANTAPGTGYAQIEIGTSTFNGLNILEAGDLRGRIVDCEGNTFPMTIDIVWFTASDGNTYYMLPDELGDIVIESIVIGPVNYYDPVTVDDSYDENDDQTTCVCFAAEMLIDTQNGPVAAGDLKVGDMVLTKDKGPQPVRWLYKREVRALGANVPVLFKKGSIGNDRDVIVSQKHRFYTGALPAAFINGLSGHDDHLIHAEQFLNDINIRLMPERETVTYVHIMFDDHELVYCQGTVSESWQPTQKALRDAPEVEAELIAIFPEIANRRAVDPGGMVRDELVFASKSN